MAQTGLHLPQRRQSLTLPAMAPMSDCCMISDSWPISEKLGVGVAEVGRPHLAERAGRQARLPAGSSLPRLKRPSGSTLACIRQRAQFVVGEELQLGDADAMLA